jgi:hypothetical protein
MKTIYQIVAAALGAGLLASCYGPYAADSGPTPLRTSGAYSAQFRGAGSTYHSWDARDPNRDWRHDDELYEADDDDDDHVRYSSTRYVHSGPRYVGGTMAPGALVTLPVGARRVVYGDRTYFTHHNMWYEPWGSGYVVVNSPY